MGNVILTFINSHGPDWLKWLASNPVVSVIGAGVLFVSSCALLATRDEWVRKLAEFKREPDIPTLAILWEPTEPEYRYEYTLPPDPTVNVHFRVCILNVSKTSVSNIRVTLDALNPRELPCVPCRLRLMNNVLPAQTPIDTFSLNPGERQFIDVMAQAPNGSKFWIWHTVDPISVVVPAQRYALTILATSQNAPAVSRSFELVKDGLFWSMKAVDG
jgi:hypothetical protein